MVEGTRIEMVQETVARNIQNKIGLGTIRTTVTTLKMIRGTTIMKNKEEV
jgi:hypothetical protein